MTSGRKAWMLWATLIAAFSLGITLVVNPRDPSALFVGLCLALDAVAVGIWWMRRRPVMS